MFRYLYAADESSPAAAFRTSEPQFDYLCDAQMRLAELRIRLAAQGEEGYGIKAEDTAMPSLDLAELSREYPGMSQSLLTLLQTVSDNLTALDGVQKAEKKKGK